MAPMRRPQKPRRSSVGDRITRSEDRLDRKIASPYSGVQKPLRRSNRLRPGREEQLGKAITRESPQSNAPHAGVYQRNETSDPGRKRKRQADPRADHKQKRRKNLKDTSSEQPQLPQEIHSNEFAWPKAYFELPLDGPLEGLQEGAHKYLANMDRTEGRAGVGRMRALSKKRSSSRPCLSEPGSRSSSVTGEAKSAQYKQRGYPAMLEAKGTFMNEDDDGPSKESLELCETLLNAAQTSPQGSLFDNERFKATCRGLQDRNEAKVIHDIGRLVVPSGEHAVLFGDKDIPPVKETIQEGWMDSIPAVGPRPQPDYALGFDAKAFTKEQRSKIGPFFGDPGEASLFKATHFMCFPFFSVEVKCGAAALDVADRQNAHTAILAVRASVELFRLAKRERELNRDFLAFSISHDHRNVRIYGYYPVIGEETQIYRWPVRDLSLIDSNGKERWTAHRFTINLYQKWAPHHFTRVSSGIDAIESNFDARSKKPGVEQSDQGSGLSQRLQEYNLSRSGTFGEDDSQINSEDDMTPESSVSQATSKRLKRSSANLDAR